jgi:hypothetical protein
MTTGKYYHITLMPNPGTTSDQIEVKMNKALDWYRYSNNCYIVYSTVDIRIWMNRLKEFTGPQGTLFIIELNIKNRNGWMPKDFWDWLKQ